MKTHIFRLKPGQDIRNGIQKYAKRHEIDAGFVITCVGSVNQVTLRLAGAEPGHQDIRTFHEKHEVVSLVGTVNKDDCHLHMAVSTTEGRVRGGHLKEAIVETTAEIVLGEDEAKRFEREPDEQTGFDELAVYNK